MTLEVTPPVLTSILETATGIEGTLTLTWNGKRFDWVNVAYFATIHVMALGALWTFSWTGLALWLLVPWAYFIDRHRRLRPLS